MHDSKGSDYDSLQGHHGGSSNFTGPSTSRNSMSNSPSSPGAASRAASTGYRPSSLTAGGATGSAGTGRSPAPANVSAGPSNAGASHSPATPVKREVPRISQPTSLKSNVETDDGDDVEDALDDAIDKAADSLPQLDIEARQDEGDHDAPVESPPAGWSLEHDVEDEGPQLDGKPLDPQVWSRILTHIRGNHPTLNRRWFVELSPRQLDSGVIQILCGNRSQLSFLTESCHEPFSTAVREVLKRPALVAFHTEQLEPEVVVASSGAGSGAENGAAPAGEFDAPLSADYTFENFITYPDNYIAQAAALSVCDGAGSSYNPLYIHSEVGLGKTHLLQAICHRIRARSPRRRVLYIACDELINQFTQSIANHSTADFRRRFRSVDVLVIDDVQFLAGRDRTQEELFHTFNALHSQGKQIVLSADVPPARIAQITQRLVNRFNWGLVASLGVADGDTRLAMLKRKCQQRGLNLRDDVLSLIADHAHENTRELEGALSQVQSLSLMPGSASDPSGSGITLDMARRLLGGGEPTQSQRGESKRVTIDAIINEVVEFYGVKLSDLQSKRRPRSIAHPRQVVMYLARELTNYSFEEIGGYLGKRDHTTIMHGVRATEARLKTDSDLVRQIKTIRGRVEN